MFGWGLVVVEEVEPGMITEGLRFGLVHSTLVGCAHVIIWEV